MAERLIAERLQPALLDRLRDNDPDNAVESRDDRVIDVERLREFIRRDLSSLLNTNNLDSRIDQARFPYVANSVLNFGMREVSGEFATEERALRIRAAMQLAIERYEPRIRAGTLEIILRQDDRPEGAMIVFDIVGEMWAQPLPLELYLRSEVDLTTGELSLNQRI